MTAAFDAIEAREAGETQEDTSDAEAVDAATDGAETDPAPSGEGGEESPDQGSEPGDGAADEQPLTPPERWSAEDKAQFAGLPREAQDLVLKREADVERHLSQKSQEIAELQRNYAPLDNIIGPRKQAWALSGFTPDAALNHLFALSDFASRDQAGFIQWFSQQHGIDLAELATGAHAPDPKTQALQQRINQLEQGLQAQQAQVETSARSDAQAVITAFAADKTNAPYFAEVEGDIAAIMPSVRAQNPGASPKELLQKAYDKAVWANETTRNKAISAREAAQRKADAAAALKAQKAGGINVKKAGAAPSSDKPKTWQESLERAADRAFGA
jgi:hypothetical protein